MHRLHRTTGRSIFALALVASTVYSRAKGADDAVPPTATTIALHSPTAPQFDPDAQRRLADSARSLGAQTVDVDGLALLDGVRLYHGLEGVVAEVEGKGFCLVDWRNLLSLVRPVTTRAQCVAFLTILHNYPHFGRMLVAPDALVRVARDVERGLAPQGLRLRRELPTDYSLSSLFAQQKGERSSHFVLREGVNLVEYKYVFSSDGRIGRLRTVVIKGPSGLPRRPGGFLPLRQWTKEERLTASMVSACSRYLLDITGKTATPARPDVSNE